MKINIKPLSVNDCWQGRRFKTGKYKAYEEELLLKLKPMNIPDGELEIHIQVGFSNIQSDIDNAAKPFIDILQKKYGFNDSRIYQLSMYKQIVKKGQEYISFDIFECMKAKQSSQDININIAEALAKEISEKDDE